MKECDCDYTWIDVKDAVNRCLKSLRDWSHIASDDDDDDDIVKIIYTNALTSAMASITTHYFVYGAKGCTDDLPDMDEADLELIRKAFIQIGKVGYIGKGE